LGACANRCNAANDDDDGGGGGGGGGGKRAEFEEEAWILVVAMVHFVRLGYSSSDMILYYLVDG